MANTPAVPLSSLLAPFALFQTFPAEELTTLAASGDSLELALGERVFRRGETGRHLYVILRGRVRYTRKQPNGGRATLATCGPGELLGDEALTPPGTYAASCRAAERTQLYRLPLERILDLICRRPEVDFWLPALLRLHRLTKHLRDAKFAGLRGPEEFSCFLDALRPVQVPAGTRLVAAGAVGDGWYYVRGGTVAGPAGTAIGRDLGPGDTFATEALLSLGSPVDVMAVTAVDCFCLPRSEFQGTNSVAEAPSLAASVGTAFSWVGQQGAVDCGAAALAMAARRLGHYLSIEDVHKHLVFGPRGVHMESLAQAAVDLGLSAQAVEAGPEAVAAVALPAIALLAAEHFVVVYEVNSATVLIGDPARGVVALGRDEFLRQWSGHLLLLRRESAASSELSRLTAWVEKTRTGDAAAWDSLLRYFGYHMEQTARRMLQHLPDFATAEEPLARMDAARLRLREQLLQTRPDNLRQAVRQAAERTRQELIEIVCCCQAAEATRRASGQPVSAEQTEQLERWQAFHEASARLPDEERELIGLYFYQGWAVGLIAELLGLDEPNLRRRCQAVGAVVATLLNHQLPKF